MGEVERVAQHRPPAERIGGAFGQPLDALAHELDERRRNARDAVERGAREFQRVERVPARDLVHPARIDSGQRRHQSLDILEGKRLEFHLPERPRPAKAAQEAHDILVVRQLAASRQQQDEQRAAVDGPDHVVQQLSRTAVEPLEVVEHKQHTLAGRGDLNQARPQGIEEGVAAHRRTRRGQLLDVDRECVRPRAEGPGRLRLVRATHPDFHTAATGQCRDALGQPALTHAGLARDQRDACPTRSPHLLELCFERSRHVVAAYERAAGVVQRGGRRIGRRCGPAGDRRRARRLMAFRPQVPPGRVESRGIGCRHLPEQPLGVLEAALGFFDLSQRKEQSEQVLLCPQIEDVDLSPLAGMRERAGRLVGQAPDEFSEQVALRAPQLVPFCDAPGREVQKVRQLESFQELASVERDHAFESVRVEAHEALPVRGREFARIDAEPRRRKRHFVAVGHDPLDVVREHLPQSRQAPAQRAAGVVGDVP